CPGIVIRLPRAEVDRASVRRPADAWRAHPGQARTALERYGLSHLMSWSVRIQSCLPTTGTDCSAACPGEIVTPACSFSLASEIGRCRFTGKTTRAGPGVRCMRWWFPVAMIVTLGAALTNECAQAAFGLSFFELNRVNRCIQGQVLDFTHN